MTHDDSLSQANRQNKQLECTDSHSCFTDRHTDINNCTKKSDKIKYQHTQLHNSLRAWKNQDFLQGSTFCFFFLFQYTWEVSPLIQRSPPGPEKMMSSTWGTTQGDFRCASPPTTFQTGDMKVKASHGLELPHLREAPFTRILSYPEVLLAGRALSLMHLGMF